MLQLLFLLFRKKKKLLANYQNNTNCFATAKLWEEYQKLFVNISYDASNHSHNVPNVSLTTLTQIAMFSF
jgi:hypothetical protein